MPPPAAPQPQATALKRYDGRNGQPLYDSEHGGHYGTLILQCDDMGQRTDALQAQARP